MRLVVALLLTLAAARAGALPAIAHPQLPALSGRVVDQARILSPQLISELEAKLAAHEQATGNQVVVATVASLQGYDIERFANELFRAWKLGEANRNNGVLLLVAPHERELRIEVGYGLEGALTDLIAADIIRNRIVPRFRANDFPGGISAGTDAILAAIKGEYTAERPAPAKPRLDDYLPLILIGLWLVFMFLRSRGQRRFARRGGRLGPWIATGPWIGGGGSRGGGFGGGGFSGGGGSSGGGGASGRW